MILAAGLGTRLRPLTNVVSKPMVQLAGRPCLEHTVRLLKKHGVNEVMVNIHYFPELIREYFGDGSSFGVDMNYSYEKELMGTAGGLKKVESFFKNDTVLIISGDGLTDIHIQDYYRFHKEKGCIATLALKRVENPQQYGVVKLNEDSTINIFQEKPKIEEAVSNLANTGIYLFEPEVFQHIPEDTFYDFGKQLFPKFVESRIKMAGYQMEGYWCDIGDLPVYREAHYDILMGLVKVEIPGKELSDNIWIGNSTQLHPDSRIQGPVVLRDNCIIEKGVQIYGPAVIGKNTVVKEGAVIKRSILWDDVCVGEGISLTDAIVAQGVNLSNEPLNLDKIVVK
ncbi:sugar phosphate nucleotidyltransferase [Candidatus Contubernalis alkaliaceticus]|uniref:sugar phosphate nucleotidyltransferase n=1 Tax=Candidatus Contubernalis alkaliaceticus TaxID=338645 RepID=UPI001F4C1E15|nr:NDP-sugar synthase [Candidatus Contubernalis alkalaceticus]